MKKNFSFTVETASIDKRIDKYLGEKLSEDFSRASIKKIIQNKQVLLNSKVVKPSQKLGEGDDILVNLSEADLSLGELSDVQAVDIPLDIIYEDDYLLVINKPAGLVVHPAPGHFQDTLVNALLFHTKKLSETSGALKPGIVHRLDKDTSGLLVVARDDKTHRALAAQFKQHKVKKIYIALVKGKVEYDEGLVQAPIGRSPFNRKKMSVSSASARQAETFYRVLERKKDFTVVELHPKTGRTHQIRVHMAHIGHPLLGDGSYGQGADKRFIDRHALHAKVLGFTHPHTAKYMEFEAPMPLDMAKLADA
ncbi:MAG: RluA family pseudouridine synthase [Candidatus Omnitrophota bacterium]